MKQEFLLKGIGFCLKLSRAKFLLLLVTTSFVLTACSGGGGDDAFKALDGTALADIQCKVTGQNPASTAPVRVGSGASVKTIFSVSASSSDCVIEYYLNGGLIAAPSKNPTFQLSSSLLTGVTNSLVAKVRGKLGEESVTWNLTKNTPPSCGIRNPSATTVSLAVDSTGAFSVSPTDAESDPLTFSWLLNGSTPAPAIFTSISNATQTLGNFTATSAFLGTNALTANINDGYDTTACNWNVGVATSCSLSSASPAAGSVRVAAAGGTSTSFSVVASDPSCAINWELNGSPLSLSGGNVSLTSSSFISGGNILVARIGPTGSSVTKTWTVVKNTPPACGTYTPTNALTVVTGVGQATNYAITATDANSDAVTFLWKLNGTSGPSEIVPTSGANSSSAVYTPASGQIGNNVVAVELNDGLDATVCAWNTNVQGTCTINSASPSATSVRAPALSSANTGFTIVPNDSSCAVSWKLNGTSVATGSIYNLPSSSLNTGTNTLVATIANTVSTITKTYTVVKNTPPVCASQTPAATGSMTAVGSPINLTGNGTDGDGDALSFSWKVNGNSVSNAILNAGTTGNQSIGTFTPTSALAGNASVVATISDSYDSTQCSWNVEVRNVCSVSSTIPAVSSVRVAAAPSTSTTFGAVPNDSSCGITWEINGSTIPGTTAFQNVLSSSLNIGLNNVRAVLSNGVSTASQVWTVTRNHVPVCSAQNPAASGNTMIWTDTKNFTSTVTDADSDSVSFTWKFDGSVSSIFQTINTTGMSSVATLKPNLGNIGTHVITGEFFDGYDRDVCSWNLEIQDPNTVQITSCTPTGSPVVVASTGGASSQTFTAVATGTSLSYKWFKDGSEISGATSPSLTYTSATLSVGTYALRSEVRDTYGNMAHCDWSVKRNAPPVLSAPSPANLTSYKFNIGSSLPMSVTGTDANGDAITYTWRLDGGTSATLPSGSSSTTFAPASNPILLGARAISVTASDGTEATTLTWNLEANNFSTECNSLMNGPVDISGKTCTLASIPGVGNNLNPAADQTKMRLTPYSISKETVGGIDNLIYADTLSHAVWYYNRTASPITRFGMTIGAGKTVMVIGNGAAGVTTDGLVNTQFKLSTPTATAIDAATGRMWVADYANHRVVMIDSSGSATTVLGITGSNTNSAANNTEGAVGTAHVCGNPAGLQLLNYGGVLNLFVSCYATHAIKRLVVDASNPNYNNAWIAVGRLSGTGTTGAAIPNAYVNGSMGAAGGAMTHNPWAMAQDSLGNLYWTELTTGNVRVLNLTGSTLSFYDNKNTLAPAQNMGAYDYTLAVNQATSIQSITGTAGALTSLAVIGPTAYQAGNCTPYYVQLRTAAAGGGNVILNSTGSAIVVTPSAASGLASGTFYSNATCSSTITTVSIPNGGSEALFYYKKVGATTGTLAASATTPALASNSLAVTAYSTATAITTLSVTASGTVAIGSGNVGCLPYIVQFRDASGRPPVSFTSRTVLLHSPAVGNFFTDAACTSAVNSASMANANGGEAVYYFAPKPKALSGGTATLSGINDNGNLIAMAANPGVPEYGRARNRYPRGIAVAGNTGLGGTPSAIFLSAYDNHRIIMYNNTSSGMTVGDWSVESGDVDTILNRAGTGGYIGEDVGRLVQANVLEGMDTSSDGTKLLFTDRNNSRIRHLDISTASGATSLLIGSGRTRTGNLGDSALSAQLTLFNRPYALTMDNSNRRLYIADSSNGKIKFLDLTTGNTQTFLGKQIGNPTVENEDPLNVQMGGPRHILLATINGNPIMLYADSAQDLSGSEIGANKACLIRAYNMGATNTSVFGTNVFSGKVATVAGDFVAGCFKWNTAPANGSSQSAITTRLFNPEHMTMDAAGNMYVVETSDHCIIKMAPDGTTTQYLGLCGTAGSTGATTTALRMSYPTDMLFDSNYAADGNFFIADQHTSATGVIKYINFRTTSINVAGQTIPAAPGGGVGSVTQIFSIGSGNGRIWSLAQFGNQLCYASGDMGNAANGPHNVVCNDLRSSAEGGFGALTMRIGANEGTSTRGGAPQEREQENVAGSQILLNAPGGIVFDSSGNLYIVERANNLIRMVRRWF